MEPTQVVYVSDVSDKAQKSIQTETRTLKLSYAKMSDKTPCQSG